MEEEATEPEENIFKQFPRNFWVINSLELLERGAYYGMMAILVVHLHDNLDYTAADTGLFLAILMTLLYFVPLIGAALAEKIGYRRTLIGAFVSMAIGYTSLGLFDSFELIIFSIIFLGIGAGAFKPIISASIARMTRDDQRNQAYAIYYWMINLGALIVPWTFAFIKGSNIMDLEANAEYVFFASAGLIGLNLLITLMILEDPAPPNPSKKLTEALSTMGTVLSDRTFTVLLLIYSGFWFMFAMCHSYLPLYMVHFLNMPEWFSVFLLAGFNPLTIVVAGPFLSKMVKGKDSLGLMIKGIVIFCVGLIILGMTTGPAIFLIGIVIFSLGEFITHPNFIAYVSKIAPADKVAVYMGYSFIPSGIGYVGGTYVGGHLFGSVAEGWERPKLFWAIVACAGFLTITAFVLYDKKFGKHKAVDVEAVVEPVDEGRLAAAEADVMGDCTACGAALAGDSDTCPACRTLVTVPHVHEPVETPPPKKKWMPLATLRPNHIAMIALLMIPIVLFSAYSGGTNTYFEEDDDDGDRIWKPDRLWQYNWSEDGYLEEGQEDVYEVDSGGSATGANITLRWTDEPDGAGGTQTNDGDTFTLSVVPPDGEERRESATNAHGQEGVITIFIDFEEQMSWEGVWNITVILDYVGPQNPNLGPFGDTDTGNAYDVELDMQYWPED